MQNLKVEVLEIGVKVRLIEPFEVEVRGHWIRVPTGFVTDFASVPRVFWRVVPPWGKYSRAAVVHDWLYNSHQMPRKEADKVFLQLMKELGVPWWKRKTMYWAVRAFGSKSWNKGGK